MNDEGIEAGVYECYSCGELTENIQGLCDSCRELYEIWLQDDLDQIAWRDLLS